MNPTQPCTCAECILAGCDRPPVTIGANRVRPQRELHGKELARFYAEQDARKGWLTKLVEDYRAKGLNAQRGDEPR